MKKIKYVILLLFIAIMLSGCTVYNNEIYTRSVVVDIDVTNFGEPIVPIAEKASQSVIGVSNYRGNNRQGIGTGVIYKVEAILKNSGIVVPYSEDLDQSTIEEYQYYAVTNRHVIEGNTTIKAFLGEEDIEVPARMLGAADLVDIAIIQFTHDVLYLPLEFGDSNFVKKGNFAIAIGNPSGYDFYGSTTFGIVSHPQRYILEDINDDGIDVERVEYIQHNVAINPGNSGGPLINMDGKIIGINTMKFVKEDIDNMGFSIPSNTVTYLIPYLEQGQQAPRLKVDAKIVADGDYQGLSYDKK